MKFLKRITTLILIAGFMTVQLAGCGGMPVGEKKGAEAEAEPAEDRTVEVTIANPEIRTIAISSNYSATVEADSTVTVVPKAAGEVVDKHFEVGDHVNEGDLLFKIDDEGAQIQLAEAKASVDSASAGYTAEQASAASTKAQATETFAKISSNEAQLNLAVDNAYAQKRAAGNTFESAVTSEEFYENEYYEAKDNLSDVKKKKKKLKKQKNELSDLVDAYASKKSSDGEDKANEWLKGQGYSSSKDLMSAYEAASSAYASADSTADQYESAIRNYDLQKRSFDFNADSAEMNYYTAEENVALAEQQRDIYRAFTKATTMFGVNAQIVGADAGIVNSEANLRRAKAGLESAKMNLDNYTITSPVSGTITNIGITLHNMASSATEAYTIEADSISKVVFYVAEETLKNIEKGNDAVITKNGEEISAKITNVGTTIDQDTGLFKVEAVTDSGTDSLLNGTTVSVRTVTRQSKNAVTVPVDAVYFDEEQAYVLLSDGNRAVRKDIETGISDEKGIEVVSGLSKDDDVIVSWSSTLKDGAEIRVTGKEETSADRQKITDPSEITAGSATIEAISFEEDEPEEEPDITEAG